MPIKKLSLKKETLLPMEDHQAQTIAGGLAVSMAQVAGGAGAICGGTIGGRCSDPCKTDGCTQLSCYTCNTCVTLCTTDISNCNTCQSCASCATCDTCRTDCVCPSVPARQGVAQICQPF